MVGAATPAMAKKKPGPKPRPTPIPQKTIAIRGTEEWTTWIETLADDYRTTVSGIVDRALAEWVKSENYPNQPPRRTL